MLGGTAACASGKCEPLWPATSRVVRTTGWRQCNCPTAKSKADHRPARDETEPPDIAATQLDAAIFTPKGFCRLGTAGEAGSYFRPSFFLSSAFSCRRRSASCFFSCLFSSSSARRSFRSAGAAEASAAFFHW